MLDDHDGLSVLDVDALVSVSVSPDQAYAEIWDQLAAARRAIVAATSPCASAPSVPPDSTCAPVIFSKVPLCAQPHAGIHDDPLFACLDFMGDGQPRRFVVYHDKEGWKQLQSQIGGACLQSVDVDNSASDFTFSANTARTARSAPVGLRWRRCCGGSAAAAPVVLLVSSAGVLSLFISAHIHLTIMVLPIVRIVGIVGQVGIVAPESPVSLVAIPGVVGLVALEGLLGV